MPTKHFLWYCKFDAKLCLLMPLIALKNIKIRMSVQSTLYGLVDILYAYCYDFKTTLGEHNSETGWLISKLSATLACSEVFDSIKDCVIANMRRTLIYPLFRSFDIAVEVLKDVQKLLKNGKVAILKILLDLTKIFNESEGRYIFNQLYIDQYVHIDSNVFFHFFIDRCRCSLYIDLVSC